MEQARSWLFVPADRWRMLERSTERGADVLLLDLEDGVAPADKAAARANLRKWLTEGAPGPGTKLVRLNPFGQGGEEDVIAIAGLPVDGIALPKVESPEAVLQVLAALERAGHPQDRCRAALLIESARGLIAAPALASVDPRVIALLLGGEDLAHDLHLLNTPDESGIAYARGALVVAARAAGVLAVDTISTLISDPELVSESARRARTLGFDGKLLIHPDQVAPVHAAFAPTAEEIAWARAIVAAAEADGKGSGGVVRVRGTMADAPVVNRARRILGQ